MASKRFFMSAAAIACLCAGPLSVSAQTVDYATLQDLFGEPVTTSATGTPQRLSDAPVKMTIITQDAIARSGVDNIPDLLDRYAGVNVLPRGANYADVAVRGYNQPMSNRLLVLVNGRQVYRDTYGYTDWATIPVQLEEIQQIELVRGPNAALFGFNAVGGVINIITTNPLYNETNAITVRGGNDDFIGASGVITGRPHKRVGLRLSAGGSELDEFTFGDLPNPPEADNPSRRALNGELLIQMLDNVQFGLEASYSLTNARLQVAQGTTALVEQETSSFRSSLHADTDFGLTTLRAYYNDAVSDFDSLRPFDPAPLSDNQTLVVQAENSFKVGVKNAARVGVEYRDNITTTATFTPGFEGQVGYRGYAASTMWTRSMTKNVSATAALRYDYLELYQEGDIDPSSGLTVNDFDRTIDNLSFNLATVWTPTPSDTARLSISRAAVLPSLVEFGVIQTPFFASNPGVDPTVKTNYEAGYDRVLPRLGATVRSSVFYQQNENFRDSVFTFTGLTFDEVGNSDLFGVELSIDASTELDGFFEVMRWSASYTGLFPDDDFEVAGATAGEETTPTDEVKASIGLTAGRFDVDLWTKYVSDFSVRTATPGVVREVDDFLQLDARLAYRVTKDLVVEGVAERFLEDNEGITGSTDDETRIFLALKATF